MAKLKKKVQEFGGCIFRSPVEVELLRTAGYPFANNEHLQPIQSFTSEQGVYMAHKTSSSLPSFKPHHKTGIRPEKYQVAQAANGDRKTTSSATPAACTIVTSSHRSWKTSILDPSNNKPIEGKDDFDAGEIREAFFRFFVASFIDYQDYFVYSSTCASSCCTSVSTAPAATPAAVAAQAAASKGSAKSFPQSPSEGVHESKDHSSSSDLTGRSEEKITFNFEGYQAHVQDPFLRQM